MALVWKLLRQHISIPQFMGFFFANLFGMIVVLLGYQFYRDIIPVFTAEDSFMKSDYIIINKKIGTGNALSGRTHTFGSDEIDEIGGQRFVKSLGKFTSAEYKIDASMSINGTNVLNSELPLESVPDQFVGVAKADWTFNEKELTVPIILPRSYIAMYNFGFAQSHSLPKINEGLVGMIDFDLFLRGNNLEDRVKGKVIGFSNRLNAILVPEDFMLWSNNRYAPEVQNKPSRLIIEVGNPADENIAEYLDTNGYEVEDDRLSAEKTTYFLRLVVTMVVFVGLIISALSFYILMLSIYLLVQKNSSKLETLLLIGYKPSQVALPYQLLTIILNVFVLVIALFALFFVRNYYMQIVETLFPEMETGTLMPALMFGLCLLFVVSMLNMFTIKRKMMRIWKRKD